MIVGTGIDIIEISRIKNSLNKFGDKFVKRILNAYEYELMTKNGISPSPQFIAGRFATKEAAFKAIGTGLRDGISFHDIQVINDDFGKPILTYNGVAKEYLDRLGATKFHLSISHSISCAIAQVILEKD